MYSTDKSNGFKCGMNTVSIFINTKLYLNYIQMSESVHLSDSLDKPANFAL